MFFLCFRTASLGYVTIGKKGLITHYHNFCFILTLNDTLARMGVDVLLKSHLASGEFSF